MSPSPAPQQAPASRTLAANIMGELMAWMDRCEAAEARVAELTGELAKLKAPESDGA